MATNIPPSKSRRQRLAVAALGVALDVAAGPAPSAFRVLPAGPFRAWDGRPTECSDWQCTREDGERIAAAVAQQNRALVLDYEHATLRAQREGKPAPAAAWLSAFEWRDEGEAPGLWAVDVEWTAAAASAVSAREYRYISPVFTYDPKTGRVLQLLHAALTNHPATNGLTDLAALAANFNHLEDDQLDEDIIEQLRWLLNLPALATKEDIAAELSKAVARLRESAPAEAATSFDLVAHLGGLAAQVATLSAQVAAPDPAKFVPVAVLSAAQAEAASATAALTALQARLDADRVDEVIRAGLAAGKLTPATEAWARDLGRANLASLSAFVDAAPVIVRPGATQSSGAQPGPGLAALTADQAKIAALLGVSPDDFRATLAQSQS